ncbi:uncharacterized protein [Linepithema humile]|uniref:uncharacterized protein n=1 Tax=Linepithema humile TaxID=83485 RepID=UPI0006231E64|nr:PREDICTED: uncharacterized protein LOC105672739 [Linepithema humile]
MTTTFLQRSIIIFAVLVCCFQSWVNAVDCELYPYHSSCRGVMTRKRAVPLNVMRALDCEEADCRLPRMKFLMALLHDNLDKDDEIRSSISNHVSSDPSRRQKQRRRMNRMEDMMRDMYSDY